MYIKQYKEYDFEIAVSKFYPLNPSYEYNISFLSYFLVSDFGYIKKDLEVNIEKLNVVDSMGWNDDQIVIDQKNNLVYLGVVPDFCCDEEYDDVYEEKFADKSLLQMYKENLLNHLIIPKNNFFHILRTWGKYLDEKPPFLLLYQDEQNWFDLMAFQSKEVMELFVKNHKPINI